jgi:multicomponent Na+:H+ antiporter subunit E
MDKNKRNGMILLIILLLTFWMIIASSISWIDLAFGFFASLLIVLYSYDMVFTVDDSTPLKPKTLKALFVLIVTLLWEIIIANFHVAKIVLSKKMPIDPGFASIRNPLKKDLNQALYGNAITMTPGTLTVDMKKDEIIVHGLEMHLIQNIEGSRLEKVFMNLEDNKHD